MCVTAIIAAAVAITAAAVGTFATVQAANARDKQAQWEAEVKQKELYNQREAERIKGLQVENGRDDQYHRARSAALAAIGASGLGEHISFFTSIDPEAQKAYLRDVRSIRLNMAQSEVSIADQVKVSEYGAQIEHYNTGLTKVGAIAEFIKTAAQAVSFYGANAAPSGGGGGGGASPWSFSADQPFGSGYAMSGG